MRQARWVVVLVTLAGLRGMGWAAAGSECADLNIELAAKVEPDRSAAEIQDLRGDESRQDRCAALAKVRADLQDVRAEYDDRHAAPGKDLSCDQAVASLDGNVDWLVRHDRQLGCGLER